MLKVEDMSRAEMHELLKRQSFGHLGCARDGRPYVVPSDKLGHEVARLLIEPSATRDRLTAGIYLSQAVDNPLAQIERALAATLAAEPVEAKLRGAMKEGRFDGKLTARQVLVIHATGKVTGQIHYKRIVIEEGGQLSGDICFEESAA